MITPVGIFKRISMLRREAQTNDAEVKAIYIEAINKLEALRVDRQSKGL